MLQNILTILFLVFLEGILSFDNALAIAAMVKPLPEHLQKKALRYGIAGAFIFRIIALFFLVHIMENPMVKAVGGAYLIMIGITSLISNGGEESKTKNVSTFAFVKVILLVELTDIAFSIDSILASVAVSKELWVVVTGGILGIITMRFAASVFIDLIDLFPRLTQSAFILVTIVGTKLLVETLLSRLDFHSASSLPFWIFWIPMIGTMIFGFSKKAMRKEKWN